MSKLVKVLLMSVLSLYMVACGNDVKVNGSSVKKSAAGATKVISGTIQ